jgi:hypothetical protein
LVRAAQWRPILRRQDQVTHAPAFDPQQSRPRACGRTGPHRYDRDFYSWSLQQARLVREGQWHAVDRENVAEEIESLGREHFSKLQASVKTGLTEETFAERCPYTRNDLTSRVFER